MLVMRRRTLLASSPLVLSAPAIVRAQGQTGVALVIGNSVARAFSLVGALSIVRFRTVVDDTRDTAFVIFSVVVGMAAGAGLLFVPLLGLPLVAVTAIALDRWQLDRWQLDRWRPRWRTPPRRRRRLAGCRPNRRRGSNRRRRRRVSWR